MTLKSLNIRRIRIRQAALQRQAQAQASSRRLEGQCKEAERQFRLCLSDKSNRPSQSPPAQWQERLQACHPSLLAQLNALAGMEALEEYKIQARAKDWPQGNYSRPLSEIPWYVWDHKIHNSTT